MLEAIRKIVVPTDFSELSEAALRTAAAFARKDDASIHLLHSIRLPFLHTSYDINVPHAVWEGLRKGAHERMYESQLWLEEAGISEVEVIVSDANQPAETIARCVDEINADLVVMATHGRRSIGHAFLGSVTEKTIRTCPVPVLAVKGKGVTEMPLRRILLPIDFSTNSKRALSLASTLAKRYSAQLDVLHVLAQVPDYLRYGSAEAVDFDNQSREFAVERLREIRVQLESDGISVQTHLPGGISPEVISDEANRLGADLIVMGTHGFTGFKHAMIGSVTDRTLRLAPCSVLTTKVLE